MSLQSQVQLVEVQQLNQEEFVNELIDERDHVQGSAYVLNRYLVLFYKCLYLRKRKKLSTLIELFLPFIIFVYVISTMSGNLLPQNKETDKNDHSLLPAFGRIQSGRIFYYEKCYYDFNTTNGLVDKGRLNRIIKNIKDKERLE